MRRQALAWIAAWAGLLQGGCGMLDARLETRTACYTVTGASIPGAAGSGTVDTDLAFDLGGTLPVLTRPGVSYHLRLRDVELAPGQGSTVTDLGGVEELDVSALPPDGTALPEVELIRWLHGSDPHPTRIHAVAEHQPDLQPYLAGGTIDLHVTATGTLPASPWSADATACFLLDVDVAYGSGL